MSSFEEAARERWLADDASATPDGPWRRISPQTGGAVSMAANHTYAAPRAEVWAAITDPDRLSAWFGQASGGFTLGGTWTVAWDTAPPPERLPNVRQASGWSARRHGTSSRTHPESTVTIELSDERDSTRLTLTPATLHRARHRYGAGWYAPPQRP